MPAISTIVLADNVPSNHTFNPISASVGLSRWMTSAAATFAGNETIDIKMSPSSRTRNTTRVTVLFSDPVEVTESGIVVVNDTLRANLEVVIPDGVAATRALAFYTKLKNLAAHATVQSYIADRIPVY